VEGKQLKKCWTHARTHGHSGDFILCPMLCIALDGQLKYNKNDETNRPTLKQ